MIFSIFWTFIKIGIFGFGGGMAMLPLIYQGMSGLDLMTTKEFADLVAISQITPGPIAVNAATYVGYQELGIKKAYFYDIVSGRTNPPPHELQIKAMEILDVTQADRIYFYDLAAKERGDVPADITKWINGDPNAKTRIRKIMRN